jgi:hypothetical protein
MLKDVGMRLFDLVEQQGRVGTPAHSLGELTGVLVADVARRHADQARHRFNVSVVQNQTLSLDSDVETTHNVLDEQDGPTILLGHSYGGVVIIEAGRHDNVAGLAYIAAFAPDAGSP